MQDEGSIKKSEAGEAGKRGDDMTREILFRGKRTDNGRWVEGCHMTDEQDPTTAYIGHIFGVDAGMFIHDMDVVRVDPKTICQYTGLTDKNGRKIFEGDILSGERYHDWGQGGEYVPDKCVIKWNEKRAAFDPVYWWEGCNHDLKDYEVIGNIFDNPELMEGGAK